MHSAWSVLFCVQTVAIKFMISLHQFLMIYTSTTVVSLQLYCCHVFCPDQASLQKHTVTLFKYHAHVRTHVRMHIFPLG